MVDRKALGLNRAIAEQVNIPGSAIRSPYYLRRRVIPKMQMHEVVLQDGNGTPNFPPGRVAYMTPFRDDIPSERAQGHVDVVVQEGILTAHGQTIIPNVTYHTDMVKEGDPWTDLFGNVITHRHPPKTP